MSLTIVRDAIVAKMLDVDGIGVVHRYQRYAKVKSDFREFYKVEDKVLGWSVRRVSFSERRYTAGVNIVRNRWRIEGFRSLDDEAETELLFEDLIEDVAAVFRLDPTIGGAVNTINTDNQAGIQLEDFGPAMFAGMLCHQARLALTTEHYVSFELAEDGTVPETVYASRSPNIGAAHKQDYRNVETMEGPDDD